MERNSLGQVIVNESGSLTLSILSKETTIPISVYNRFLLANKEFTELVPTIDKDALINNLESELLAANTKLTQEQINIRGGCNVGVTNNQVVRSGVNRQKITFDTVSGSSFYNSIQSNGLPVYSLADQAAILYEDANSRRFYTLKSTIKYRYRYIGLNASNKTTTQTFMRFFKDNSGGNSQTIGSGVDRIDNISGTYNFGDVTQLFTINLSHTGEGLGGLTDKIFVGLASVLDPTQFELIVYPGSTFTVLPE